MQCFHSIAKNIHQENHFSRWDRNRCQHSRTSF